MNDGQTQQPVARKESDKKGDKIRENWVERTAAECGFRALGRHCDVSAGAEGPAGPGGEGRRPGDLGVRKGRGDVGQGKGMWALNRSLGRNRREKDPSCQGLTRAGFGSG